MVSKLQEMTKASSSATVRDSSSSPAAGASVVAIENHATAMRIGDEVHRMRVRCSQLAESTATKALNRSVDRIEETLNEAGYTMPELVGKSYHDGMTVSAQFVADETLTPEQRVIARIIRPQINFRDMLIQPAEVEVRTGVTQRVPPLQPT
jgi:hypothetical protein